MKVAQSCLTLCNPMDYTVHGILQAIVLEAFPSPRDLPNPGIEPRPPALQADSLPAEPQGKPKNTGVGSLSLLQRTFPTQESNQGLLHCRRILYQLSYQGSPVNPKGNQSWIFIGRIDAKAETPILWPPNAKSWLSGQYCDAGKDWRREEKGMPEDEMVGWHHRLNGHESE